jgi:hypothetical protein
MSDQPIPIQSGFRRLLGFDEANLAIIAEIKKVNTSGAGLRQSSGRIKKVAKKRPTHTIKKL